MIVPVQASDSMPKHPSASHDFERSINLNGSPEERPITLTEDMECNLEELSVADVREVCERLREELRRRTVALASAVHELRTPLAVMDGYIELLYTGKAGSLNDKQTAIVEDMRANEKR